MLRGIQNGTEIRGSQTYINIESSNIESMSRNFLAIFSIGDIFRVQFAGNSTSVTTIANSSGSPATSTKVSAELVINRVA
jgi:hypothetical protein